MELIEENKPRIVWTPLDGSQSLALDTRAQHTLYTGTRGPGKSECQLARFRRRVGMGYGSFWRGIIIDREYKNLDDLVSKSKRFFYAFNDGAVFLSSNSAYRWVWPTGEELMFRSAKEDGDYWNYHGQDIPFIGWNELSKYPTSALYDMFMSCNRSSWTQEKDSPKDEDGNYLLPPMPLEVFSTTNPWGAGHGWVKERFIDPAPYGTVIRKKVKVFDPQKQENVEIERTQVAIFGSWIENKYLDPIYITSLMETKDENMKKAWLTGDWDIAAGGMFSAAWKPEVHIKRRFVIPKGWRLDRTFDWGSAHPFWVGFWAEANGESAMIFNTDGSVEEFCPPRGSYVLYEEIYGTEKRHTNRGLGWAPSQVADEILRVEQLLRKQGWIDEFVKIHAGPADNQIRNVTRKDQETIEKTMAKTGVRWAPSDKSNGSRKVGKEALVQRLHNARKGEGPGIYVMDNCRDSIDIIPNLPRDEKDPDDVDTTAEDHPYDGWRYKVLGIPKTAAKKAGIKFARSS